MAWGPQAMRWWCLICLNLIEYKIGDVCFLFLHLFMCFSVCFFGILPHHPDFIAWKAPPLTAPGRSHQNWVARRPLWWATGTWQTQSWYLGYLRCFSWGWFWKKNTWDFLELQQNMEDGMHKTMMGHPDGSRYVCIPWTPVTSEFSPGWCCALRP